MRCQCLTCINLVYVPVPTGMWVRRNGRPNGYFGCHGLPVFRAAYKWSGLWARPREPRIRPGISPECDYYWPGESLTAGAYFAGRWDKLEAMLALGGQRISGHGKLIPIETGVDDEW